jgi:AcrR family transcriptional regulator
MESDSQSKPRLTREDWVDAAIELLTGEGIAAVTVDRIASNLTITRGSFYHHFSDREDLLRAMLDHWAHHWTFAARNRIAALGLDPSTTLLVLMKTIRSERLAAYDAPFRAWALHDSLARETVRKVDEGRLAFIQAQFEGIGFTGLEAENRARLFLHYEMAVPAMFAQPSQEREEELLMERHRFLTTAKLE